MNGTPIRVRGTQHVTAPLTRINLPCRSTDRINLQNYSDPVEFLAQILY